MQERLKSLKKKLSRAEQKKVLTILPAFIPSTIILAVEPLVYLVSLRKIKLRIRLEYLYVSEADFKWADVVVFCRNTDPAYRFHLERVLALKKPYVYELDDNFFDISLDTPEGKYHRATEQIGQLVKYIKNADLVRVYSPVLEKRVKQYTSKIKLVKAPVNLFSIPELPPLRSGLEKLKIVYATSRTTFDSLSQVFVKDILRVINEFGSSIEVHFWGFIPEELKGLPQVRFHRFIPDYQKYMNKVYKQGYDIGLAPLKNDAFHNSKTNNKFREYGACWIAGIYSNSEIYSASVIDGVTGILVSNDEGEWYKAIVQMLDDADLRKSIQMQSRAVVEAEYSLTTFAILLLNHINLVTREVSGKKTFFVNDDGNSEQSIRIRKLPALLYSTFGKIRRAVNKHGVLFVSRLILDEAGKYMQYFLFSFKVKKMSFFHLLNDFWHGFRRD